MAEGLVRKQAANDPQHYNERFDSARQSIDRANELQGGRKESALPPAPSLEPGNDPDLWRVTPLEVKGETQQESADEDLQDLDDGMLSREESVEWHKTDIFAAEP